MTHYFIPAFNCLSIKVYNFISGIRVTTVGPSNQGEKAIQAAENKQLACEILFQAAERPSSRWSNLPATETTMQPSEQPSIHPVKS